jgi:hypothetical protein
MKYSSSKSQNKLAPEEPLLVLDISLKHGHRSISRPLHSEISGSLEPSCALNLLRPSLLDPTFQDCCASSVPFSLGRTAVFIQLGFLLLQFPLFPGSPILSYQHPLASSSDPKTHPLLTLPLSDNPSSVGKREPPLASEMNPFLPGCSICMPCRVVEMLAR